MGLLFGALIILVALGWALSKAVKHFTNAADVYQINKGGFGKFRRGLRPNDLVQVKGLDGKIYTAKLQKHLSSYIFKAILYPYGKEEFGEIHIKQCYPK
jgi:hypothetical protein